MTPVEALETLESFGGAIRLDGESVMIKLPRNYPEVERLLVELRTHREEVAVLLRQRAERGWDWPPASLDPERRFGQPHAKLFPYLGRKVRTPDGPGTLLQVFADRVTVLLDSDVDKCAVFSPEQIRAIAARGDD